MPIKNLKSGLLLSDYCIDIGRWITQRTLTVGGKIIVRLDTSLNRLEQRRKYVICK